MVQGFFVVVTRRIATPLPAEEALGILDDLASSDVVAPLWDSVILTAAGSAGCDRVVTEDLGHGDLFDGLLIENPFT